VRVLALGLDGADYDFTRELVAQGRLPTLARLAREGTFGPLRSTVPAMTPTAWSSFLTGLNPAGHGIFNFSSNPNRSTERVESAASRAGAPFWRALGSAGIRSAYVLLPFTYPPEPLNGVVVTGYGGPARPEILPAEARERILAAYPGLVTAHHPMAERWWEDFPAYARRLHEHAELTAGVSRLVMELEPDLRLLCVDFMSSDHIGHLGFHRLDPDHPAHDPRQAGTELVQVYETVDRLCGELIEEAERRFGEEPTVVVLSDHGMKPIHWVFHLNRWLEEQGHLRYRKRSLQRLRTSRLGLAARVDRRLVRTRRGYGRAFDLLPVLPRPADDRSFGDIDFGSTQAYGFGAGGQLFLGELSGARDDPRYAERLADELTAVRHPESGEPAFRVARKEELYRGPYLAKAPDLVVLPRDERIYVDATRRPWERVLERHETLDPQAFFGFSGHHGLTGILAAAGPGIAAADVPEGSEITQMAATLLRLFGLEQPGADGAPIEPILADSALPAKAVHREAAATAREESVYSEEEERLMVERLRDLGYE
jgi:predicted AlkP superfamily phosphohydrolase/phosphomutase